MYESKLDAYQMFKTRIFEKEYGKVRAKNVTRKEQKKFNRIREKLKK